MGTPRTSPMRSILGRLGLPETCQNKPKGMPNRQVLGRARKRAVQGARSDPAERLCTVTEGAAEQGSLRRDHGWSGRSGRVRVVACSTTVTDAERARGLSSGARLPPGGAGGPHRHRHRGARAMTPISDGPVTCVTRVGRAEGGGPQGRPPDRAVDERNLRRLNLWALALGGDVRDRHVECPAPGRSPTDRSVLAIPASAAPDGLITYSRRPGTCWREVRAHVLGRLRENGLLPDLEPAREAGPYRGRSSRSRPT